MKFTMSIFMMIIISWMMITPAFGQEGNKTRVHVKVIKDGEKVTDTVMYIGNDSEEIQKAVSAVTGEAVTICAAAAETTVTVEKEVKGSSTEMMIKEYDKDKMEGEPVSEVVIVTCKGDSITRSVRTRIGTIHCPDDTTGKHTFDKHTRLGDDVVTVFHDRDGYRLSIQKHAERDNGETVIKTRKHYGKDSDEKTIGVEVIHDHDSSGVMNTAGVYDEDKETREKRNREMAMVEETVWSTSDGKTVTVVINEGGEEKKVIRADRVNISTRKSGDSITIVIDTSEGKKADVDAGLEKKSGDRKK